TRRWNSSSLPCRETKGMRRAVNPVDHPGHQGPRLDQSSSAGDGHRVTTIGLRLGGRFHAVMAVLRFRWIEEVRLVDLFPGYLFAGVAGDLPHDCDHGAPGHVIAAVDRVTRPDCGEQAVVLHLIRIARALPSPTGLSPNPAIGDGCLALAAKNEARI